MRLDQRSSMVVLTIIVVGLALAAGLVIPLASGGGQGSVAPTAWTPPPTATATALRPPATVRPPAATRGPTPTGRLAATATATRPVASPTLKPTAAATATATRPVASPTLRPTVAATATTGSPATVAPTGAAASPTGAAKVTAAVVATPTANVSAAPIARVKDGPLSLRAGPARDQAVIAMAQVGATYTVTARTADAAWLQICCVGANRAWLFAEYVTVTGALTDLPIQP